MTAREDALYFEGVLRRESQKPRELWEIYKKYRGYAIGATVSMWSYRAATCVDYNVLNFKAKEFYDYLGQVHFVEAIEDGTRDGYIWVREQLAANFEV